MLTFRWEVRPKGSRGYRPKSDGRLPSLVLVRTDWDDFGYKTDHQVYFFNRAGQRIDLPDVKILDTQQAVAVLPNNLPLSDRYYSLGSSVDYYSQFLHTLRADGLDATRALTELRDVVAVPELLDDAQKYSGFDTSLLRFSEAQHALHHAASLFGRVSLAPDGFQFAFSCLLNGFEEEHLVGFDFSKVTDDTRDLFPRRIMCLVGKNGTGKSGVLSRLASTLSGDRPKDGTFPKGRPHFRRTICVSYGVFQAFRVPSLNTASYRYCGLIHNDAGDVELGTLTDTTADRIVTILSGERRRQWESCLKLDDIAGREVDLEAFADKSHVKRFLETLSSGQRMVVSIMTDVILNIENQSLLLFDEPESYLHPTLLSTLMRMIHSLLNEFDSYAIIATHSPIVVQEVAQSSVRVFGRDGAIPILTTLSIQSLGASLTEIVDAVFEMNSDDKNYRTILRDLLELYPRETIDSMLGSSPAMSAKLFLRALSVGRNAE